MTEKEIAENNKLIAEFIGLKETNMEDCWDTSEYLLDNPKSTLSCSVPWTEGLFFHMSWNCLMSAIQECLNKNTEELDDWESYYEDIHDSLFQVEIIQTYKEVIKFIQWYNQNKTT